MPHVQTWAEEDDVEVVTQLIKRLKTEDYAVILSIHWGVAFEEQLADYQRPLAHSLVDAGADFVAGHHPHVIQGIEIYDARAIFYSLSNFIMHDSLISPAKAQVPHSIRSHWMMSRDAATARLTIDGGRITEVAIVPVHIGPDGFGRWAIGERAQGILNHTRSLSEAFGTQWAELERGEPASVLLG